MTRPSSPNPRAPRGAVPRSGRGHWDDVGDAWRRGHSQRTWRAHSDAVNGRLLDRWLPRAARRVLKTDLFDEAVGGGLVGGLQTRAGSVFGIDVALATASGARAGRPDLRAVVADVRSLPFREGVFDVVVSTSTLDHFEDAADIEVALREAARVLRPGGELVVTLDNASNPLVRLRNALPIGLLRRIGLVPYFVGATLGAAALREHVAAAGLEVLEQAAVLHCPRAPSVALAGLVDRLAGGGVRRGLRAGLLAFEALERWPTRHLTAYFVAARARKGTGG